MQIVNNNLGSHNYSKSIQRFETQRSTNFKAYAMGLLNSYSNLTNASTNSSSTSKDSLNHFSVEVNGKSLQATNYQKNTEVNVHPVERKSDSEQQKQETEQQFGKGIELSVTPLNSYIHLPKGKSIIMPIMISVSTELQQMDQELMESPGIDLICVIDRSGSMGGNKIECAKQALNMLLQFLHPNDRLCLINFNEASEQMTDFLTIDHKDVLQNAISEIQAYGDTNIASGLELAISVLKERKYINKVTSIFLLSDGQDGGSYQCIPKVFKTTESFSVHSFGFGSDHDAQLMSWISNLRSGNFYYVEKVEKLAECFVDAFGCLAGTTIQNLKIKVYAIDKNYLKTEINFAFGDKWKQIKPKQTFQLLLHQFPGGIEKNYLLELKMSKCKVASFGKQGHTLQNLFVKVTGQHTNTGEIMKSTEWCNFKIFGEDDLMIKTPVDKEVQDNYNRVKGAYTIQLAQELCDQGQFEQAKTIISKQMTELNWSSSKPNAIMASLKNSYEACDVNKFESLRTTMIEKVSCEMYQQNSMQSQAYSCPTQLYYQQTLTQKQQHSNSLKLY